MVSTCSITTRNAAAWAAADGGLRSIPRSWGCTGTNPNGGLEAEAAEALIGSFSDRAYGQWADGHQVTFDTHPNHRIDPTSTTPVVLVATDGSCLRNPGGPSGWAWYVDDGCWSAGGITVGTNQQAELAAVLAALTQIPAHVPLQIVTDSQYALKACTVWMAGWKAKGWRKSDGQPVMNLALMQALDEAMAARTAPFTMVWTRGHQGDVPNENADHRCGQAARSVAAGRDVDRGPAWGTGPTGIMTAPPASPSPARTSRPNRRRR
jgi:ribonuclease HI